ncbi:Na+/H+ antiporter subunit E [Thermocatellispora tengchongensis]|uniref:Na+/H+ antiporter subunit E n=1 Tax=Thermocatellispora tengchongensis TaxID=1073253 RepID=UPI003641CA7F
MGQRLRGQHRVRARARRRPHPPVAPAAHRRGRPRLPWHCLRLFAWFVADMASSAANVAWQAVRPGPQPPNAVIAVTLRTRSDLTMTITALALCAVPGSLITEVRRSTATLYIHVLGVRAESELERVRRGVLALERRVIRALGNAEDRRLLAEEGPAP